MLQLAITDLGRLDCFKKRVELAQLAIQDFSEKRYHACIPVVLALLDGMGQEATGTNFLRQGARFAKVDSFLEIGPGVASLIRRMTASRSRTTTNDLDFPYRHGILHGIDLGYATPLVAAKTWGALLAVGAHVKASEHSPASATKKSGLLDTIRYMVAHQERSNNLRKHLESWSPRDTKEIVKSLANGVPANRSTPEATVIDMMNAWSRKNYGLMAQLLRDLREDNVHVRAGRIRRNIGVAPETFSIVEIDDETPGGAWVALEAQWDDSDDRQNIRLRLVYSKDSEPMPCNMPGGSWLVVSLWPLEAASLQQKAIEHNRTRPKR